MTPFKRAFLVLLPIIGCVIWYLLKVLQFQTSPEQYADGMVILQLSRGWLEGRPFLFDTVYGHHAQQHNYYFIPLVGILTKPMGVYGLFTAYLGLVGFFFWKYDRSIAGFNAFERTTTWLTAFFFVFGPMGYFIYLDYFGWHPEHYLIPLLALLSLSLAEKKRGLIILWLLLALSVKESSVVLLCCLLLFCSVVDMVLSNPARHRSAYILNRRNLIITGVSLVVFLSGLWLLSYLNGSKASRLGLALSRVELGSTLLWYLVSSCLIGLLTFGLGMLPFIPWLRLSPHKKIIVWTLAGGYAILFVMFATEALFYFPVIYPGVSYPARLGGLWAFMLSAFIFFSYRLTQSGTMPSQTAIPWILTGGLLQFLLAPFLVAHYFTFEARPSVLSANVSYMVKTRLGLDPYPEGIARQLYMLARRMPYGSEVIVPFHYTRFFENIYPAYWEEDGRRPAHILGQPLLYMYEKDLVKNGHYHDFPGKDYTMVPNEHLLILVESNWYQSNLK
ncbi:MAG: hypothetical protein ABIN80_04695 [Dyadobacter sp.]|uniref:hypothetical protein n=1 Tax=Dyadobacter sp. TaxID=1914288 RepID=UPI003266A052